MTLNLLKTRKATSMKTGLIAASLLGATLCLNTLLPLAPHAFAADSEAAVQDTDTNRFIRMGLNKSVVVRLPAEARDVIVGNTEVVDAVVRTKNTAYLFARKTGQTNVFFFDAQGQQILALDLEVALDVTAVRKLIGRALPGNQIIVDTVENNVVLGGVARNALEAQRAMELAGEFAKANGSSTAVVNTMSIAGEDQVMLKVKVVEIQRNVLKQFGIDFAALMSVGKFAFQLASINPFTNDLLAPDQGYKGVYSNGSTQFEGLLRAMEGDGLVRTLAEPNLTALTGEQAKFHAGGEFPFRLCEIDATTNIRTCTTEFKNFGVEVEFKPTVLSENRINLRIKTNVSEIASIASGDVPVLNTRASETVLELPSGGSMMLAGLIKESTRQNLNGTPGLKKLPILGQLFRSQDYVSNETELVIFVTPILVKPTTQADLTSPDKGFNPATDKQTILFSRLNKIYGGKEAAPQGTYQGNVGFIVE
jgi:pilus assembly protein CpaC